MNVALIAPCRIPGSRAAVETLHRLGQDINYRIRTEYCIAAALERRGHDVSFYGPNDVIPHLGDYELLLFFHDPPPTPHLVEVRQARVTVAQWMMDLFWRAPDLPLRQQPHYIKWHDTCWRQCDHVFLKDLAVIPELRAIGVPATYLDQGCDSELDAGHADARRPPPAWHCDVGFAGTPYEPGGRVELLQRLADKYVVHVWSASPRRWQQAGFTAFPPVYGLGRAMIAKACKVVLCKSWRVWKGYWSDRMWRFMAAGACCLVERVPELNRVVRDREHVVTFDGQAEAWSHVDWLLRDDAARERIAAAGQKHALEHHSLRNRVDEMIQAVEHGRKRRQS